MAEASSTSPHPTTSADVPIPDPITRAAKRSQSPSPPSTNPAKRARLSSSTDSPPTVRASPAASPGNENERPRPRSSPRRNSVSTNTSQEERKRSLRLFGGMLSTLSQSGPNVAEKKRLEKRLEIEKKQAEKARVQREKDEEGRLERLERLRKERMREQVRWDEDGMRIRHENMLARAHFLRTKTEPVLYFKPWELRPAESERIKEQIAQAEETIKREVHEFKVKHGSEEETVGEESAPVPTVASVATDSTNSVSLPHPSEQLARSNVLAERDAVDENSEVVVEGDEDTVIY